MKSVTFNLSMFFAVLFFFTSTTFAETATQLPGNENKRFVSENDFYEQLDKKVYKEYDRATYSVRKKMSYKEVAAAELTFLKKTGEYFGQKPQPLANQIDPDRQVYFLASFYQNEKEEFHKFIVLDAETKVKLYGGDRYHHYVNPYK
ncbi:hypothetical protein ACQCVB_17385 [Fictibacillus phosphorivorans]|uniref:hypothetical protein n=1 Tax=Fictibacillus phosphorivorans TaxID=1221500 RepID=UPI003CF98237